MEHPGSIIRKTLDEAFAGKVPDSVKEELTQRLVAVVPSPALPAAHQVAAISFEKPKTAALAFDRVWAPFKNAAPDGIAFFGGTRREVRSIVHTHLLGLTKDLKDGDEELHYLALWRVILDLHGGWSGLNARGFRDGSTFSTLPSRSQRWVSAGLAEELGVEATAVYASSVARDAEYKPGAVEVVTTCLSKIALVDEDRLTWEQVLEFRSDPQARRKYKRLVHWLEKDMLGKPETFVVNEVADRYDAYLWALKKHGISTTLGALSSVLDHKTLLASLSAGTALTLAGQPIGAAVLALAIAGARCAVEVSKALLDLEHTRRTAAGVEVAFLYDAQQRLGPR